MWKRALKPLPTKPMPRRSVLMSFAERVAVSSSIGREALLAPVELRVRHAQFRERGRRAPVPVGRESIAFIFEILYADPARPESGRCHIAEAVEEADSIGHCWGRALRPCNVVENCGPLRFRRVGERLSESGI